MVVSKPLKPSRAELYGLLTDGIKEGVFDPDGERLLMVMPNSTHEEVFYGEDEARGSHIPIVTITMTAKVKQYDDKVVSIRPTQIVSCMVSPDK